MNEGEVLVASNLSKKYIINHQARFDTLREMLGVKMKHYARALVSNKVETKNESVFLNSKAETEEFWALRDVSSGGRKYVSGAVARSGSRPIDVRALARAVRFAT